MGVHTNGMGHVIQAVRLIGALAKAGIEVDTVAFGDMTKVAARRPSTLTLTLALTPTPTLTLTLILTLARTRYLGHCTLKVRPR